MHKRSNTMKMMKTVFILFVVSMAMDAVVTTALVAGSDRTSPRIVGMGRVYTASSRGLDALGLNPANLALEDRNATVTLNLAPFGFQVGSDLINYKIYNDFFTGVPNPQGEGRVGKNLTAQDKEDILGLFPGGIAHTQFDFEIQWVGFTVRSQKLGGIGFSVTEKVGLNLDLPEGYLKFMLHGFEDQGSKYVLDNTAVNSSWLREYNLSYARILPIETKWFKELAVGIGIKYVQGFAYLGTNRYSGTLENIVHVYEDPTKGMIDTLIQFVGKVDFLQQRATIPEGDVINNITKPAGTGLGFDFGLSAEVSQALRVGMSITDIGSIKWNKNSKAIRGIGDFTITDPIREQDVVTNAFKGRSYDTTSFTTNLPTALHFGAALQVDKSNLFKNFFGKLLVAADLHVGFNNEPGNSKTPRFGLGMEYYPIGFLPLRTGVLFGGRERFAWGAGLGFHVFNVLDIDFATSSIAILTNPDSFRNGSFTFGLRWRI
jgi:hypothetical protein